MHNAANPHIWHFDKLDYGVRQILRRRRVVTPAGRNFLPYHLDEPCLTAFPNDATVAAALAEAGLPRTTLEAAVRKFVCPDPQIAGFGYQQSIAKHLEAHLRTALAVPPLNQRSSRVSPRLNEKADLGLKTVAQNEVQH